MNAKIKKMISFFILCCMWVCCFTSASAAEYTSSSFRYVITYGSRRLEAEGNKVYAISSVRGERIGVRTFKEDGTETYNNILQKGKRTHAINKKGSLLYAYKVKKGNMYIIAMNKKGKIKATYPIEHKFNKLGRVENIAIKGNKIYYMVYVIKKDPNDSTVSLQSYNIKTQKTRQYKQLKGSGWIAEDDKWYHINYINHTIEQYTLKGKKVCSYEFPEGERKITIHSPYGGDEEVCFGGIDFVGRYIYNCNRNGVYRCDTEGNKTFELIYSGANDPVFNPKYGEELGVFDMEVLKNGNFHLFLGRSYYICERIIYRAKE